MERKQLIWTCNSLFDDDARKAYQDSMREWSGEDEYDVTDEEWADEVCLRLENERANLDKEVDGVIVALADLGLWNCRRQGYRIVGGNVAGILRSSYDAEWFGDSRNIRGVEYHHDGVNHILYRVARGMEEAERIAEKFHDGGANEARFRKMTRSLYPYVAEIYGWGARGVKRG